MSSHSPSALSATASVQPSASGSHSPSATASGSHSPSANALSATASVQPSAYPVVAEIWSTFEATLLVQAKKLVEDIAAHQGRDSKELWTQIKKQIRIPLADAEFPEPTLCSHSIGSQCSAVLQLCRAPCLLGFGTCPKHANQVKTSHSNEEASGQLQPVEAIKDMDGHTYYVDSKKIARDKNGKPKGIVKEDVLYLFNTP